MNYLLSISVAQKYRAENEVLYVLDGFLDRIFETVALADALM